MNEPAIVARPDPATAFFTALCLSLVAGYLDGFTYVGHGGVFASAMTGNVLLLAIRLSDDAYRALDNFWPILAFILGVFVANLIKRAADRRIVPLRSATAAALVEIAILVGVCLAAPWLDDIALVAIITIGTALQNTMFRTIGERPYNSIIMTGNLLNVADSLASGVFPLKPKSLRRAGELALICVLFFLGALAGAVLTPILHRWTPIAAAGVLGCVAIYLVVAMPAEGTAQG